MLVAELVVVSAAVVKSITGATLAVSVVEVVVSVSGVEVVVSIAICSVVAGVEVAELSDVDVAVSDVDDAVSLLIGKEFVVPLPVLGVEEATVASGAEAFALFPPEADPDIFRLATII